MARSDSWLAEKLQIVWAKYFSDIPQSTPLKIAFGRRSHQRLGSIALRVKPVSGGSIEYSRITISSLLAQESIPDLIIEHVIAHEIVHYVHGFGSHRPRLLKHPHQGGVIIKEFQKRGVWELFRAYQAWMKVHWPNIIRVEREV